MTVRADCDGIGWGHRRGPFLGPSGSVSGERCRRVHCSCRGRRAGPGVRGRPERPDRTRTYVPMIDAVMPLFRAREADPDGPRSRASGRRRRRGRGARLDPKRVRLVAGSARVIDGQRGTFARSVLAVGDEPLAIATVRDLQCHGFASHSAQSGMDSRRGDRDGLY